MRRWQCLADLQGDEGASPLTGEETGALTGLAQPSPADECPGTLQLLFFISVVGDPPCCTATVPVPVRDDDKRRAAEQPHHRSHSLSAQLGSGSGQCGACQAYQGLSVPWKRPLLLGHLTKAQCGQLADASFRSSWTGWN